MAVRIREADARNLDWIPSRSVHLIVTSLPYWTLKRYETHAGQLGEIDLYENFLDELDKARAECARFSSPAAASVAWLTMYVLHANAKGAAGKIRSARASTCGSRWKKS
jgi:DNA modification methylase